MNIPEAEEVASLREWVPIMEAVGLVDWLMMESVFEQAWSDGLFHLTQVAEPGFAIRMRAEYRQSSIDDASAQPGTPVEWCVPVQLPPEYCREGEPPRMWPVGPQVHRDDVIAFVDRHMDQVFRDGENWLAYHREGAWTDLETLAWIASRDVDLVSKVRRLALNFADHSEHRLLALRYICWKIESAKTDWPTHLWESGQCQTIDGACGDLVRDLRNNKIGASMHLAGGQWTTADPGAFVNACCDPVRGGLRLALDQLVLLEASEVQRHWQGDRRRPATPTRAQLSAEDWQDECRRYRAKHNPIPDYSRVIWPYYRDHPDFAGRVTQDMIEAEYGGGKRGRRKKLA